MKLSAVFLVGVNIVACSQVARAADTASFLEESLASAPPARASAKPAATRPAPVLTVSHARPAAAAARPQPRLTSMTPITDDSMPKMRAFVPGRFLPSESDLQPKAAPTVSQPVIATAATSPLSGQISTCSKVPTTFAGSAYAPDYVDQLALAAARKVKNIAKHYSQSQKAVPGTTPVMPGQFAGKPSIPALADLIGADPAAFSTPEPRTAHQPNVPLPPAAAETAAPVVPQPRDVQQGAANVPFVINPPNLSKYEQSRLMKLVEANLPERVYAQGINGEMRGSSRVNPGLAGAGPPPFPLNFGAGGAPSSALAGGSMQAGPGMEARFGNWHDRDNLPSAGFHTYVSKTMAGPMTVSRASGPQGKTSRRTGRQSVSLPVPPCQVASSVPVGHTNIGRPTAARCAKKGAPVKSEFVACYPQYRRYPSGG